MILSVPDCRIAKLDDMGLKKSAQCGSFCGVL